MQSPIEQAAPGLVQQSAFRPASGLGVFTRLRLTAGHVEVVRLGAVVRRVPLSAIVSFVVRNSTHPVNLRLAVADGPVLTGHVAEPGVWRLRLRELLGAERDASPDRKRRVVA